MNCLLCGHPDHGVFACAVHACHCRHNGHWTEKVGQMTTKIPGVTLGGDLNGTSLCGYVEASYAQLKALLGEPNADGDGYKVSTEWVCTFEDKTFTLYDYKETNLYDDKDAPSVEEFRALKSYDWHIGGNSREGAERFKVAIQKAIRELL